jgi:hypothetical protein
MALVNPAGNGSRVPVKRAGIHQSLEHSIFHERKIAIDFPPKISHNNARPAFYRG